MEILDTIEDDHDDRRPAPPRKPLSLRAFWRGFFRQVSPWRVLVMVLWFSSSLHVWLRIVDLVDESSPHPLNRPTGQIPVPVLVFLAVFNVATLTAAGVTWHRHGPLPAGRWIAVAGGVTSVVAWVAYNPDRAMFIADNVVLLFVLGIVGAVGLHLWKERGERIEGVVQASLEAVAGTVVLLLLTGFVLAYGPGALPGQLLNAPAWFARAGDSSMAWVIYIKYLLVLASPIVIRLVGSRMTKF